VQRAPTSSTTYGSFDELNESYPRLRETGIVADICLDNFGDWAQSSESMRSSPQFKEDLLGKFVDPDRIAADRAQGTSLQKVHEKATDGDYAPAELAGRAESGREGERS
jgi:hypothetical protein